MTHASQPPATHRYIVGIGSNRRHAHWGKPRDVVDAAIGVLAAHGDIDGRSSIVDSAPIGPARRRFANAAAAVETHLAPPAFLGALKEIERAFGRRSGVRWGDRVVDLDILLWSGGIWADRALAIPHTQLARRSFALDPAATICPEWRDPVTQLTLRQLSARRNRPRPSSPSASARQAA